LCLDHLRKRNVRKEDAPVAVDASGEEYSRLEQFADARSGANPERDAMRLESRAWFPYGGGLPSGAKAHFFEVRNGAAEAAPLQRKLAPINTCWMCGNSREGIRK